MKRWIKYKEVDLPRKVVKEIDLHIRQFPDLDLTRSQVITIALRKLFDEDKKIIHQVKERMKWLFSRSYLYLIVSVVMMYESIVYRTPLIILFHSAIFYILIVALVICIIKLIGQFIARRRRN